MTDLKECYDKLSSTIKTWTPEPLEVIEIAEAHRLYWKPEKIKYLLIAESHVYTAPHECIQLSHEEIHCNTSPTKFIKLVYCLGYKKTWQYWRLFQDAVEALTDQKWTHKLSISDKINILNQMNKEGIWLLDICPLGLYGYDIEKRNIKKHLKNYEEIIKASWELYSKKHFEACYPEKIIVIGKMVWNHIQTELPLDRSDWIYQPNAFKSQGYLRDHDPSTIKQRLQQITHQYKTPPTKYFLPFQSLVNIH